MSAVAATLLAAAALGGSTGQTRLSIVVYPQGRPGPSQAYVLRCSPARGTVPDRARACATLARLAHPFAPVPPGTVCTQIALGPQDAFVSGLVGGQAVWAHLRLRNGCEIERWRRVREVVPGFGGSSS